MKTLVATCFYLVKPKPNRSHDLYKTWFLNLLSNLNTKIIVFTDEKSKDFLSIEDSKIEYQILPFNDLYFFKKYGKDFWEEQQKKDINPTRVWQLSLLYNEKCKFVEKAIDLYKNTEWFVWCDIGCFRKEIDINFPEVSYLDSKKMTLLQIKKFKKKELRQNYLFLADKQIKIGGGVQIATKETWQKWIPLYDKMFTFYHENATVNCDQSLLASVIVNNKELVDLVKAKKTKITKDKWFYLLEYCSNRFVNKKPKRVWPFS
ncbi:hypothetical protein FDT66_12875 [Polaribacter aestuariivivens]|uniref:Uncharacterized protein n=1 Tax=Polaribacter aestuariivivens TaxID=2304626 RepID=A0A5S3N7D6_9FLAO|nr:WlaTC/HtrL family glycosyltransferase [Polaribacter aestuariivivens]TMM28796.1 hypothetical protein FDT66_12875 [Polaribacter aestuariivivens]